VLEYPVALHADLKEVEKKVNKMIDEGVNIGYADEGHIDIGDVSWECTGPRTHVHNTEDIENFRLIHEYKFDPKTNTHLIIGLVGPVKENLDGFAGVSYAANL